MYRKLKRTWSNSYSTTIPYDFKKVFPELSKVSNEEICDRLKKLNMDFYYEERTPISFWMRLTMPFAILLMLLMLVMIPVSFFITGEWGYSLRGKNRLLNWFRALRLQ